MSDKNNKDKMNKFRKMMDDLDKAPEGGGGSKVIYSIKPGDTKRLRFMSELSDFVEVPFLDNFAKGVMPFPSPEFYEEENPYEELDLKVTDHYFTWVYEVSGENPGFKVIGFKFNKCSPMPSLFNISEDEEYNKSITQNDMKITRNGSGTKTTYSVIPSPAKKLPKDLLEQAKKECTYENLKSLLKVAYKRPDPSKLSASDSLDDEDSGGGTKLADEDSYDG